mgnify:CR=1 FL=1
MPTKDTSLRKARDSRMRTKHRLKYKARHRANEVFKIPKECSIKECNNIGQRHHPDYGKPEDIVWLCEHHHKQIHRKYPNQCKEKKCDNKHHSKGYCKLHYNRWMRLNPAYYEKELERNKLHRRKNITRPLHVN